MDGFEVAESHFLIKLIEHGLDSPLCSQVVSYRHEPAAMIAGDLILLRFMAALPGPDFALTCCKGVAGVQTHRHPGLVSHFVNDALQLREVAAHRIALTAHVLQH